MILSEIPLLEIIAAITACVSVYLYGNGTVVAPFFGLFSQIFWWWWTIDEALYYMMFLNVFMTLTHIRNIFKMKGRQ
tara:strand:- start:487 stop:717 length:231 start_codon:yes stop_codon:yes gene_type:complete